MPTLQLKTYRIVDARTSRPLEDMTYATLTLATQHAEKMQEKGIAAIVEHVNP